MGNRFIGDEKQAAGKPYLTVSRKVYAPCRHFFIRFISNGDIQ